MFHMSNPNIKNQTIFHVFHLIISTVTGDLYYRRPVTCVFILSYMYISECINGLICI